MPQPRPSLILYYVQYVLPQSLFGHFSRLASVWHSSSCVTFYSPFAAPLRPITFHPPSPLSLSREFAGGASRLFQQRERFSSHIYSPPPIVSHNPCSKLTMENKHVLRWQRASASPERPAALTAAEAERIVAESNRRLATAERHHRRFVAAMAEARTAAAITEARLRYSGRGSPAKGQRGDDGNESRSQSVTRTTSMNSSAHLLCGSAAASRSPSLGRGRRQYYEGAMAADGGVGDAQHDGDHLEASSVFEFARTVSSSGVVSGLGASHNQHRAGSVSSRSGAGMHRSASAASSSAAGTRGHSGGGFYVSAARNPTERDSKGNYNAKAPPRTTTVAVAAPPVRSTSAFS